MRKFSHAPAFVMQTLLHNLKLLVKLKWLQLLIRENRRRVEFELLGWELQVGTTRRRRKEGRERSLEDEKTERIGGLR